MGWIPVADPGVNVEDDTTPIAAASTINFGVGLNVVDDGGGTVTVDTTGGGGGDGAVVVHAATPQSDGSLRFEYGVDLAGRPTYTTAGTLDQPGVVVFADSRFHVREVFI